MFVAAVIGVAAAWALMGLIAREASIYWVHESAMAATVWLTSSPHDRQVHLVNARMTSSVIAFVTMWPVLVLLTYIDTRHQIKVAEARAAAEGVEYEWRDALDASPDDYLPPHLMSGDPVYDSAVATDMAHMSAAAHHEPVVEREKDKAKSPLSSPLKRASPPRGKTLPPRKARRP